MPSIPECGIWSHRISTIGNVLSLLNVTCICWILRCVAFIPPRPKDPPHDIDDGDKSFVCLTLDLDPLQNAMGASSLTHSTPFQQVN